MTAFDTQFASGAMRSLLAHHGEEVVYLPRNQAPRTITALVNRREIQTVDGLETILAPQVTLEALDDPDDEDYGGIDPALANSGGDKVRIAWVQGGELENRSVSKRLPSDGGVVRLEIV